MLKITKGLTVETILNNEKCQPYRANPHDAGADLCAMHETIIRKGYVSQVRTGVSVSIPEGYVGLLFSRSGHGKSGVRLSNSVGVIDSGYQGEVIVCMTSDSDVAYVIKEGERIAQLVVIKCEYPQFKIVNQFSKTTDRGENGLGSTGKI